MKRCKYCDKEFDEGSLHYVFCSDNCWQRYNEEVNNKLTECEFCHKMFKVPIRKYGTYHVRHFCSDECSKLAYREKTKSKKVHCLYCNEEITVYRNEKTNRFPKLTEQVCDNCKEKHQKDFYAQRVCRNCGKTFDINYKYNSAFCSSICYTEYNSKENYGSATPKGICEFCGKEFDLPRDKNGRYNKDKKFCSEICGTKQYYKDNPMPDRFCQVCGEKLEFIPGETDPSNYKRAKYCKKPECRQKGQTEKLIDTCFKKYGVKYSCFLSQAIENGCTKISKINKLVAEKLEALGLSVGLDTVTIDKYSYDIHIEGTNILIEINPTYTHNVLGSHYNNWQYDKKYEDLSLIKTQCAEQKGYRCVNIWDWDDLNKIIDIINPNKTKLYARKLCLKVINKQQANAFVNCFHLQGSCYGNTVNLGLFDKEKLIQIMTFGRPRYNKNYEWELLRLCTHSDYKVIGGAEKLFKHFVNNYKPKTVISYCDVAKFNGDVYTRLSFDLLRQTPPQKIWSKNSDYITDNLLRQRGFDQLIGSKLDPPQTFGKGSNNEELMVQFKWLPVYDCGQKVFVWHNKSDTRSEEHL